jgi:uncharacterized protein (TIGR04141 family)
MTKARSFSIYLLKEAFAGPFALKDDNKLEAGVASDQLPEGASLYILDSAPKIPWWKTFFGVQKEMWQVSKGALVFLPAGGRWFALCFGHVAHNLKDTSYEYDFGLRVTLNCVDPEKLKSTDILEPSGAKRQRTQLPTVADLTFFDVDSDSTILKSLTGKVKKEHEEVFKHATGSSNIRISSSATPPELVALCEKLLTLYADDTYKTAFPDIQNISPVRDPAIIAQLNEKLVTGLRDKDDSLSLSVPKIVDYADALWGTFTGVGTGEVYDDIFIARYYEYLEKAETNLATISLEDIKKHQLLLTDEDGANVRDRQSIFRCLIFDTLLDADGQSYHLCEGNWYSVDADYVTKLSTFLDPLCKDIALPSFNHNDEGAYNLAAAAASPDRLCMDKLSIAPAKQKQLEPCDVYEIADGKAVLHHVKISTLSAQLSHLFNQGTNSVNLLRSEPESMAKMKAIIADKVEPARLDEFQKPLDDDNLKVIFGIITHKNKEDKSKNLPLFSRITLMRCMKELKRMSIEAEYGFIDDQSPATAGKKRKRRPKGAAAELPEAEG